MRVWLALAGVAALAGCVSPEMERMRSACASGDMQACYAAESASQAQRTRMSEAMRGMSGPRPMMTPTTTSCHQSGSQVMCTSF